MSYALNRRLENRHSTGSTVKAQGSTGRPKWAYVQHVLRTDVAILVKVAYIVDVI